MKIIAEFIATNPNVCFMAAFIIMLLAELRKKKLLIGYSLVGMIGTLALLHFFLKDQTGRVNKLIYCMEYMHIPLVLYLLWEKKVAAGTFIGNLDKTEIYLLTGSFLINLAAIGYLFLSNRYYIYPCSVTGIIGNYYYNADPSRGITYAITGATQKSIHPLYRFVLNLFLIPCVILFHILGRQDWLLGGYYIAFIQAAFNSISVFVLYRIMKGESGKVARSACFALLYVVSSACLWTAVLPETYSLTVCLLLVTLYLFQKNAAISWAFAILSIGINPILCVAYIPFLYKVVKDSFIRYCWLWLPVMAAGLYLGGGLRREYIDVISRYRQSGFHITSRICDICTNIFIPGFLGPHTTYVGPYFFQKTVSTYSDLLFLMIAVLAVFPIVKLRKSRIVISAACLLAAGAILHGAIGFGLKYGFIYSPIYIPMIIILMVGGLEGFKSQKIRAGIITLLTVVTCFSSFKWFYTLGRGVATVTFPIEDWTHPSEEMLIDTVEFEYSNNTLSSKGETLLTNVDSIQVSEAYGQIVGTLYDGTIYIVSVREGKYDVQFTQ